MFKLRRFGSALALSLVIAGGMTTFGTTTVEARGVPDKICAAYQAIYNAALGGGYTELAGYIRAKGEKLGCTIE